MLFTIFKRTFIHKWERKKPIAEKNVIKLQKEYGKPHK